MKTRIVLTAVALMTTASAATAQRPGMVVSPPATWATAYGLMYTNIASVVDPESQSRWVFDDNALGFGVMLHRQVRPGLLLGVDASFARSAYERRVLDTAVVIAEGDASLATAMASGRFGYGGGGDVGFYLTGGIGTVAYRLEDLAEWNSDFALQAGTGLELRIQRNLSGALEWGRVWGYHEREGLGGGSQQHSVLKLILRYGF